MGKSSNNLPLFSASRMAVATDLFVNYQIAYRLAYKHWVLSQKLMISLLRTIVKDISYLWVLKLSKTGVML